MERPNSSVPATYRSLMTNLLFTIFQDGCVPEMRSVSCKISAAFLHYYVHAHYLNMPRTRPKADGMTRQKKRAWDRRQWRVPDAGYCPVRATHLSAVSANAPESVRSRRRLQFSTVKDEVPEWVG